MAVPSWNPSVPASPMALLFLLLIVVLGVCLDLSYAHEGHSHGFSPVSHHHCDHEHHDHDHHHQFDAYSHGEEKLVRSKLLPEELAEEEDMKLYGFGPYIDHDHDHFDAPELSGLGLWVNALGCSLLVSMASLICLIILPVIFVQGKPSKAVVDSLALFGAGAMLGDAFLHQLPHAFGGGHSHAHDNHGHPAHEHSHERSHGHSGNGHSHAHSLEDLSVGISVLAGIVLFLLVEKLVRYVENHSEGSGWSHGHHHHKKSDKLKNDSESLSSTDKNSSKSEILPNEDKVTKHESLPRKRNSTAASENDKKDADAAKNSTNSMETLQEKARTQPPSNLVFGYLNLFSDGVHNFTDGMALGSAFLLYGSVGGWSRTLFLLAHELPQEVGDFGILVRSGFSVSKALFFNFLSALMALAGTVMALLMGKDPGQSSLIEGFTAGGFIYISVAGVLAEMNSSSKSTLTSTALQLTSLVLGMAVALGISLVE